MDLIEKKLRRYRIIEKIGAGGMGQVYRAFDERLERDVAIKVLMPGTLADESARKRFRREALSISRLNHPHIATIYDFDTQDNIDLLVMEYVSGTTLARKIAVLPLKEEEVAEIGIQIASALEEAHDRGIVHRDLKPGNVAITQKNQVKVLDFGLATLYLPAGADEPTRSVDRGRFAGTIPYMAPEQILGEAVDPRTDTYALGVVLFEMATGQRPFQEKNDALLTVAIVHHDPPSPRSLRPTVSEGLENIILKAMEKRPENRYQTAKEIAVDLRRLKSGNAPITKRPERVEAQQNPWEVDSVVALPAKVFGTESDAFLTEAIPNAISTQLSREPSLQTLAPPGSLDIQRFGGDMGRIAEVFGASAVLLSSLTVDGERLVLTLQLVNARNRRLLWSQEFEGLRGSFLGLARTAAEGLCKAIRPSIETLAPSTTRTPSSAAAASEAEVLYQQGMYFMNLYANRGLAADFGRAYESLERASTMNARRGEALAGIARLHAAKLSKGAAAEEIVPQVESWARKALQANPRLSQAWGVLSELEQLRPMGEAKHLEYALKAAAFDPRDTFAHTRLATGTVNWSYKLALHASQAAARLDPLALIAPLHEAVALAILNRPEEAMSRVAHVERIEPDMPFALIVRSALYAKMRKTRELALVCKRLEALAEERRVRPEWVAIMKDYLSYISAAKRKSKTAMAAAGARLFRAAVGENPFPLWQSLTQGVATTFSWSGDSDSAVEVLCRREKIGLIDPFDYLLLNDDIAPLRKLPKFAEILEHSRKKFLEMAAVLEEARARGELPGYFESPLKELLEMAARAFPSPGKSGCSTTASRRE